MAMLGNCTSVGASTTVTINELTTVAAAYALSGFATDAGGVVSIGAPSSNATGLADAVANAGLLANTTTGTANASTATVLLPTVMLNTLADALAACVNTVSTATSLSGTCSTLYGATTAPGSSTAPADTFAAALNMAKYPGNNVTGVLGLVTASAPFVPAVSTTTVSSTVAPNDLTLGIAYLNSTQATAAGNSAVGMTIDNSDNVWVLGASSGTSTSTYNYISELTSPSSTPAYSNTLGSTVALDGTHTLRTGAFDTLGNLWITDKNSTAGGAIELPKSGSGVSVSGAIEYTYGITALDQNSYFLAVDAGNNIWTASYGAQGNCTTGTSGTTCDYVEFQKNASTPYTATNLFGGSAQATPTVRGMAADTVASSAGLGNIWTANYGIFGGSTAGTSVEVLTPSTGALSTITIGTAAGSPFGIALDATGGGYVTTTATQATSGLYYVPQTQANATTVSSTVAVTGNTGTTLANIANANSSLPASTATTPLAIGGLNGPGWDAVDGAGNVWVANYNYGSVAEYSPTLAGYVSPYYGFSPSLQIPSATVTVTAVTLASSGTANIYYTGDTAVNGQQVTFSGFTGAYAFLNGKTYTISGTSFNYFIIPDGGVTAVSKTTTSGTAVFSASNQVTFQCGNYVTTTTTVTCTTVGNATSRNNAVAIDRAGTVWTLGTNGTLVGIIGTAAPTNPVLAAGQSGKLP
jgi:hypothetical protein